MEPYVLTPQVSTDDPEWITQHLKKIREQLWGKDINTVLSNFFIYGIWDGYHLNENQSFVARMDCWEYGYILGTLLRNQTEKKPIIQPKIFHNRFLEDVS